MIIQVQAEHWLRNNLEEYKLFVDDAVKVSIEDIRQVQKALKQLRLISIPMDFLAKIWTRQ
ncbi:hypothetical protein [Nostoc sp.]|uniref:hypothetical protein n=1 Tax=Nostoc sp. TaxID=1180 RepID=UPI002FFAFBAA